MFMVNNTHSFRTGMELKRDVCAGLTEEMKAFEIDKVISRKAIERL